MRRPGLFARLALAFAGLLAGAAAPAADGTGWQAYKEGHYGEAVRLWQGEAAAGSPEAAFGLGLAFDFGTGVPADVQSACTWYRWAALAGHISGAFNLAVMHDGGDCGARQPGAAIWYGRAAAAGHARAAYDLAQLYETGDGVPANPEEATLWYQAAKASGITAAAEHLASLRKIPPYTGPLRSPEPLAPAASWIVAGSRPVPLTLTWAAPRQPGPVTYFVELVGLEPSPRPIFGGYSPRSVLRLTPLPPGKAYAWRVMTVSLATQHYAESGWMTFRIEKQAAP